MNSTEKKLIKKFLSTQVNNINNNNWEEFYNDLHQFDDEQYELHNYLTPIITEILYKIDINPLLHMKSVPKNFLNGSNITSFTIPDNIETIDKYAFYYCDYLTSIKLSNNLGSIEESAFENCKSLSKITFPASLQTIKPSVFYDCYKLKDIHYNGTTDQWANVKIDKHNSEITSKIIHCKDGDIKAVEVTFGGGVRWKKIGI